MSYTETPRLSHHIQRLAKLDKNGRADVADHTSHDNIRYFTGDIPTIKMLKLLHDKELTNMESNKKKLAKRVYYVCPKRRPRPLAGGWLGLVETYPKI